MPEIHFWNRTIKVVNLLVAGLCPRTSPRKSQLSPDSSVILGQALSPDPTFVAPTATRINRALLVSEDGFTRMRPCHRASEAAAAVAAAVLSISARRISQSIYTSLFPPLSFPSLFSTLSLPVPPLRRSSSQSSQWVRAKSGRQTHLVHFEVKNDNIFRDIKHVAHTSYFAKKR